MKMLIILFVLILFLHKYDAIDILPKYNPRVKEPPAIRISDARLPALRPALYDPENEMYEDIDSFTKTNNNIVDMYEKNKKFATTVVLVARCLVITSASEIHSLPKLKFRTLARVVLGSACSGPGIRVMEYTFHPHFKNGSYSALALLELNSVDYNKMTEIRPICGPPAKITDLESYAIVMNTDCTNSTIGVYKMEYTPLKECQEFYRRNGLDVQSIWPTYAVCARSLTKEDCIWREGNILAMKEEGRWRLLGFGVNGPGCGMPSRYIDYSIYYRWIQSTIARAGRPAFTRRSANQIVLRKTNGIQRYGACDASEVTSELFTDETTIDYSPIINPSHDTVDYNMTIYTNIDYSCIMFTAVYYGQMQISKRIPPKVEIRYYCVNPSPLCLEAGQEKIEFVVRVLFKGRIKYRMAAYGRERKVIDPKQYMRYLNKHLFRYPAMDEFPNESQ